MSPTPLTPDETLLWNRLRAGEREALGQLYDLHARALHRYGRRILHDDQTVWDAVHDVFVDVWKYRETLTVGADGRFYLLRALRNRLVRRVSEATRWTDAEPEWADDWTAETAWVEQETDAERQRNLREALGALTPRQREIIRLKFFDERSYEEIANLLHVNKQSVHNLMLRALEVLRSRLLLAGVLGALAGALGVAVMVLLA